MSRLDGALGPSDLVIVFNSQSTDFGAQARETFRAAGVRCGIFSLPGDVIPPFAFVRQIGSRPPHALYFVSDHVWYLGDQLAPFDGYTENSFRRYYFGNGVWARVTKRPDKADLLAVHADQHRNEVAFLSNPPAGFPAPRLLTSGEDEDGFWLVREIVDGETLSDLIVRGSPFDHDKIISDVLAELVALEKAGLHYADLRAHNVIVDPKGTARLVDFGSISGERRDRLHPDDLFLVFIQFVFEVTKRFDLSTVEDLATCRAAMLNFTLLPPVYQRAFERLFALPLDDWSFAGLQALIQAESARHEPTSVLMPGFHLLAEKLQITIAAHQKEIKRLRRDVVRLRQQNERDLNRQVAAYQQRINAIEDALRTKENELEGIYASTSWKLTAPLRRIKRTVQKPPTGRGSRSN